MFVKTLLDKKWYLLLSSLALVGGLLFYGLYNDLILIRLPSQGSTPFTTITQRKPVKLIYWNNRAFVSEEKEILFSSITETLTNLIKTWLSLLEEEGLMLKKVSVQSVKIDESGRELYLSFDRNPLPKEHSTYQKLQWLEGLLRTIKESGLPITSVRFLVYAKPLNDHHLDFSQPWPVSGYLGTKK